MEIQVTRSRRDASFGQQCQRWQVDGVESELEVERVTQRCSSEMDAALTTAVSHLHQGWQYKPLEMMKHELNEKDTNAIFPGCL